MTNLEKAIPSKFIKLIGGKLDEIEQTNNVKILFAVESGSRAWGFPSPDSDYDVRFVYVHSLDWYLSVFEGRDVIEPPIDGDLDVNGWDLRKALQLLIKPNPVLLEWICSPLVYRSEVLAVEKMVQLSNKVSHSISSAYHYLHLAEGQFNRYIDNKSSILLKKYFYVLRPTMALAWLQTNPGTPVPMSLPELRNGIKLPADVDTFIDELLAKKAKTKELGLSSRVPCLDNFIENEIMKTRQNLKRPSAEKPVQLKKEANEIFREIVKQYAPPDK